MFEHDQLHAKCASFPNPDCLEMCEVTVVNQGTKMLIVCVYRPPSSSVSWWDSLRDALESLTNTYPSDQMVLVGDLNVDVLDDRRGNHHFTHLRQLTCFF